MASRISPWCYRHEDRTITGVCDTSIDGQSFTLEVRSVDYAGTIVITKSATASGFSVVFTLSATDTDLTPATYFCTISRTNSGSKTVGASGTFTVKPPRAA